MKNDSSFGSASRRIGWWEEEGKEKRPLRQFSPMAARQERQKSLGREQSQRVKTELNKIKIKRQTAEILFQVARPVARRARDEDRDGVEDFFRGSAKTEAVWRGDLKVAPKKPIEIG